MRRHFSFHLDFNVMSSTDCFHQQSKTNAKNNFHVYYLSTCMFIEPVWTFWLKQWLNMLLVIFFCISGPVFVVWYIWATGSIIKHAVMCHWPECNAATKQTAFHTLLKLHFKDSLEVWCCVGNDIQKWFLNLWLCITPCELVKNV